MASAIQELLRTGRDPNDSYRVTARYADDWSGARFERTLFDTARNVVELEPLSLVSGPESWLPLGAVVDAQGDAYRADRSGHRLLRRRRCEDEFTPIECLGGRGWQTGQFDRPAGVTLDERGRLLVADAGNHRVQIVDPERPGVIAVLGRSDQWGRYVAGGAGGAMVEPVQAVRDPATRRIYVADRAGGRIHVFDDRFEHLYGFVPDTVTALPALPTERRPVALRIAGDGALWVLDAHHPRIMRMSTDGEALDDIGVSAATADSFAGGRALRPRYAAFGEVVVGPLDSGVHDQSWHKITVEMRMPEGAGVRLQSCASDDENAERDTLPWAPAEPVPLGAAETRAHDGRPERLVLSDTQAWERYRHGDYLRSRPDIHVFAGDGPTSSDRFTLSHEAARRLRVGDTVEFDSGTSREELQVSGVSRTALRAYGRGVAKRYAEGSEIRLLWRAGRSLAGGARLVHTLATGEAVDLSAAVMHGRLTDLTMPHAAGALARIGDRFELRHGDDVASLEIESLDVKQTVGVSTDVAVGGDYRVGTLRASVTPGRLLCVDLAGFEHPPPRRLPITVDAERVAAVALAEPDVATLWLDPGSGVDFSAWSRFTTRAPVATDRGRYLWLRLQLHGALRHAGDETAIATPTIASVGALTPRPSYLKLLPALYSRAEPAEDPVGSLFLERFLALFEGRFTAMESAYEGLSSLLNIETTDEEWLDYLSTWMGLVLDPSWSVTRRRQLLLEVMDLYQRRGTRAGLSRYLEIYTGKRPVILEGFQWRPPTSLVVGRVGRLGCGSLDGGSCDHEPHAHRFGIHVFVEAESEPDVAEAAVRNIIDSVKPAHADYDLMMALPETRVGCQSRVGIDMVLSDRPVGPLRLASPAAGDEPREGIGYGTLARRPSGSRGNASLLLDAGGIDTRGLTLS